MTSQLNAARTLRRQLARAEKRHASAQAMWLTHPSIAHADTLTSAELALMAARKRAEAHGAA